MGINENMKDTAYQLILNEIDINTFLSKHEKLKEKKIKNYNKTLDQYLIEKNHKLSIKSLIEEHDR